MIPVESKNEVIICLGSSCFARGNKPLVKVLKDFIRENNLADSVNFRGRRCFDACAKGPVVKINSEVFEHMDESTLVRILESKLL